MDLTITIIGISLFLLATVPILVLVLSGNKKSKSIKKAFDELIMNHKLHLTEQETWNDNIIGIDAVNKKVLYAGHQIPKGIVIHLNEIATCNIVRQNEDHTAVLKGENAARMGILFKYRGNDEDIYLPFYNIDVDDPLQMSHSSKRVFKWYNFIDASCKSN